MNYKIYCNKDVSASDFRSLLESVGWGSNYSLEALNRSIAAYPFVAHARDDEGKLLGYISAFSDRAFSTMLGELIVLPSSQKIGIGRALLSAVENTFPNVPIYAKPLGNAKMFFLACGFRVPATEICVLYKKNEALE